MIGSIELFQIDKENATAFIGHFILADDFKYKGYGTKALKLIKDIAFNELNLQSILLGVYAFNVSAIRCYEKIRFRMEKYIDYTNTDYSVKWNSFIMKLNNTIHS